MNCLLDVSEKKGAVGKKNLDIQPEIIEQTKQFLEEQSAIAGSPQDEKLTWTHLSPGEVSGKLAEKDIDVSVYHVQKVYEHLRLRRRKMLKTKSLKEVEYRNEQFENIAQLKAAFLDAGLPVLSIDTKKKELLGNFYRPGYGYGTKALEVNDHDFPSFATGTVVPHGIYDVGQNKGYLTLGTSKDTSAFVCDNLRHYWIKDLQWQYPEVDMALLLCDGGGSNNSKHHVVKHDLFKLAEELEMMLVVAHYPPYCSKWNPIEHRLFSRLTKSWEGMTFSDIQIVKEQAEKTTTSTGLEVKVWVNDKVYETGRKVNDDFVENIKDYVSFSKVLPQWNYFFSP